ncbi:MAG: hypothetical protein WED07_12305 [Candidatus Freyarchaeum deiterrae]
MVTETVTYPKIFSGKMALATSIYVFVMLAGFNILVCYSLSLQIFPSQFNPSIITFSLLLTSACVSAVCIGIIPTNSRVYRSLGLPKDVKNDAMKISIGWALAIPSALLAVIPTLAAVTLLYLMQYIGIFPAVYLTVLTAPAALFVMWVFINSLQIRPGAMIYLSPKIMGVLPVALAACVAILLYAVYIIIAGWQNSLSFLKFYFPFTWLTFVEIVPVINVPDAWPLVLYSGIIILIYGVAGVVAYLALAREMINPPSLTSGQIIVMEAGKPLEWKWNEIKDTFSELKGDIWASFPYLNEESVEMFRRLPTEGKIRVITGVIRNREEFLEGIDNLNKEGWKIGIRKIYITNDRNEESPVFHDRFVIAENMLLFLGTDIMKGSMVREFFTTKIPSTLIEESNKIRGLLRHYWEIKENDLKKIYGETAKKVIITKFKEADQKEK